MAPRQFQSTRPVWGATCFAIFGWILFEFQSTRPVWGATFRNIADYYKVQVSIHAPRVGRDCHGHRWRQQRGGFNPRAPCGARRYLSGACPPTQCFNPRAPCGARHHGMHNSFHDNGFQSTRPVWGATKSEQSIRRPARFQSTRPVWGATIKWLMQEHIEKFQSTRPVWGATRSMRSSSSNQMVSIHAPRVGRDP